MGDEQSKRLILARRARFIAAALAGTAASTAACGKAEPCLSQIQNLPDTGSPDEGVPAPCLTAPAKDAGHDADADADVTPDAESDADSGDQ